jgi:hypothetical protein
VVFICTTCCNLSKYSRCFIAPPALVFWDWIFVTEVMLFMCLQQTVIICLFYWFTFIMEMWYVDCEVGTKSLNIIVMNFSLQLLTLNNSEFGAQDVRRCRMTPGTNNDFWIWAFDGSDKWITINKDVRLSSLVGRGQRFGEIRCLYLQEKDGDSFPVNRLVFVMEMYFFWRDNVFGFAVTWGV